MKVKNYNQLINESSKYTEEEIRRMICTFGDHLESIKPDLDKYLCKYTKKAFWNYTYSNLNDIYYLFMFDIDINEHELQKFHFKRARNKSNIQ